MRISGSIVVGTGRGAKFISLPIYEQIFEKLLSKKPFHGTLNLQLKDDDAKIIKEKFIDGTVYDESIYKGKAYGGIITLPIKIVCDEGEIDGVAVRPHLTSHSSSIIEIVSHKHLRSCLKVGTGDVVQFYI